MGSRTTPYGFSMAAATSARHRKGHSSHDGHKARLVFFDAETQAAIGAYLEARADNLRPLWLASNQEWGGATGECQPSTESYSYRKRSRRRRPGSANGTWRGSTRPSSPYTRPWMKKRCRCSQLQPKATCRDRCRSAIVLWLRTSRRRQISRLTPRRTTRRWYTSAVAGNQAQAPRQHGRAPLAQW